MKFPILKKQGQAGNALVLTVVVTGLVGFTLASYLTLVKAQNMNTMRSQAWNGTIPVIEAGLEDALAHLNANGTNRLDIDGWHKAGDVYWIRRFFRDAYYVVTITNWFGQYSSSPVVESRGYVRMPVQVVSRSDVLLAQTTVSSPVQNGYMVRGVRARTRRSALFAKGMVAKGQIDLNGNNIATDSFDSTDPNHSTDGQYDSTKRKDNGHVATNSGLTNSLSVGNADIRGKVSTGPGGSVDIGPTGIVGSAAWHDENKKGIEPGYSSDDMNVDFPDVEAVVPSGAWTPGPGMVNGELYEFVLGDGNYVLDGLYMNASTRLIATGDAVLYVNGNISVGGSAYIEVAEGASLEIYGNGISSSIGGNGVINRTGFATNFAYYGTPNNTYLSLGGNSAFIGVIYAPQADFQLNGSGSEGLDFVGASITASARMNGSFTFHYDEALEKLGPGQGYVVTTWNEMGPNEVASLTFLSSYDLYPLPEYYQ